MRRRTLVIAGLTIIILLISCFSLVYYFVLRNKNNVHPTPPFIYPNTFFENGSISDMVLETDDIIHFIIRSTNETCTGSAYVKFNYANSSFQLLKAGGDIATYHILDIDLTPEKKPIIYKYLTNSFFYLVGSIQVLNKEAWEEYPSLQDDPVNMSQYSRGPLLNWTFAPDNNLTFAYIYDNGFYSMDWFYTPTIYSETNDSYLFMHSIFPQIKNWNFGWRGDFLIKGDSKALLFHRIINQNSSYPCLLLNSGGANWTLFELGSGINNTTPLLLEHDNEGYVIYSIEQSQITFMSKLIRTRVDNSSLINHEVIKVFNGKTQFYFESVSPLTSDAYICFYSLKESSEDDYDLYRGIIKDNDFLEQRLTDSPDLDEYGAHCEVGVNFLHYSWYITKYHPQEHINEYSCIVYYNRTYIQNISLSVDNISYLKTVTYQNQDVATSFISAFCFSEGYNDLSLLASMCEIIHIRRKKLVNECGLFSQF